MNKERYVQLDIVKGLFSFFVITAHFTYMMLVNTGNELANQGLFDFTVNTYGLYFVLEFYFIVSGFFIACGYRDKICADMSFKSFMLKRIAGFIPLVFLSEFLSGLIVPLLYSLVCSAPLEIPNFYLWFESLLMCAKGYVEYAGVYPISVITWYVDVLIIAFVMYWLICYVSRKRPGAYVPLCILGAFFGYVCLYFIDFPLMWESNGRGYCAFFVGVLLYEFQSKAKLNKTKIAYTGMIIALVLIVLATIYGGDKVYGNVRMSMIFFMMPTLVLSMINIPWLSKFASLKIWKGAGNFSTNLVFSHMFTLGLMDVIFRRMGIKAEIGYKEYLITIAVGVVISYVYGFLLKYVRKLVAKAAEFYIK